MSENATPTLPPIIRCPVEPEDPDYYLKKRLLKIEKCEAYTHPVRPGTPTVDLHLVDAEGNPYLAMVTKELIRRIAEALGDD